MLPDYVTEIYPNPVQYLYGKPIFVFRDHRWILPILFAANAKQSLKLPAIIVTFDRHKDFLSPKNGTEKLRCFRSGGGTFDDLIHVVKNHLSPRDDDWIVSGMELGFISDVIQFSSEQESNESFDTVSEYTDSSGTNHRLYHLGRPMQELSYKGAFADNKHKSVSQGLWDTLGWDPSLPGLVGNPPQFILDIDLDFFTFAWDMYTFPFTEEIYDGEFLCPCQSSYYEEYLPLAFIRELARKTTFLTIACEPNFCGGQGKSHKILSDINNLFLENELIIEKMKIDYTPAYPDE